ncbi:response regulator [Hansschlegelia sp.]|uniref:response regulator n=1 Tax=Hansschlegelia sp. TaxID=2041892 RepID=UPI002B779CFB|nr:response regulator [Hansschlegelia sp.]HVI27640.1 response regulator [Hansschlegelia sp.]
MTSAPLTLRGRRVLFVEDDYFLVRVLVDYFRGVGAEIAGPVARLQPALQIARTEALDGAVLDLDLQGQCSLPVAAVLVERDVPFVFVTGYDGRSLPEHYANYPRCQKPVDPSVVARKLFPDA